MNIVLQQVGNYSGPIDLIVENQTLSFNEKEETLIKWLKDYDLKIKDMLDKLSSSSTEDSHKNSKYATEREVCRQTYTDSLLYAFKKMNLSSNALGKLIRDIPALDTIAGSKYYLEQTGLSQVLVEKYLTADQVSKLFLRAEAYINNVSSDVIDGSIYIKMLPRIVDYYTDTSKNIPAVRAKRVYKMAVSLGYKCIRSEEDALNLSSVLAFGLHYGENREFEPEWPDLIKNAIERRLDKKRVESYFEHLNGLGLTFKFEEFKLHVLNKAIEPMSIDFEL